MSKLIPLTGHDAAALAPCALVPASDLLPGSGQPQERGLTLLEDGDRGAGLWEATPYAERMNDYGVTEMAIIVAGRVRITPDGGASQDFGPGDAYVMAKGFKGTFEVLETLRKYYFYS